MKMLGTTIYPADREGETISQFVMALMVREEFRIEGPNARSAAREIVANQRQLHEQFFANMATILAMKDLSRLTDPGMNFIRQYIEAVFVEGKSFLYTEEENACSIMSNDKPVITEIEIGGLATTVLPFSNPDYRTDVFDDAIALYVLRTRFVTRRNVVQDAGGYSLRLAAAIARCASDETFNRRQNIDREAGAQMVVRAVEALTTSYAEAWNQIEVGNAELRQRTIDSNLHASASIKRMTDLSRRMEELSGLVEVRTNDFRSQFDEADSKAEAFLDAVRVKTNFQAVRIHWADRARGAWWAYLVSWIVLAALLVVFPVIAIWQSDAITAFFARILAAAAPTPTGPSDIASIVGTVSRLVIITVPLALYFWLIRLVVRYQTRSMLLLDDARQRETMLETYYRMVEQDAARVEDRALVLQAILRPTPGHGPDSVEPPNFTDVISKAMSR